MEKHRNDENLEKYILVAVSYNNEDVDDSLNELEDLVKTASAITVGRIVQNRDAIHPVTYVGKGKIDEIREQIHYLNADGIICDDELTPVQLKNLEQALETKIIDRTLLILDIFAKRAITKEGIIQVELAQLKYRLTRLVGLGHVMSRQGGGIGSKGPGEKKLETDRRYIRSHISSLSKELEEIKKHRHLIREQRKKNRLPVVALVGYTNAGKSTLLNKLTMAGVLEEDKLFATLDPTTRQLLLPSGKQVLITDTVGFIRKLPHHLIDAFKSTLEEAKYADILIHVVDSSNETVEKQIHIVYQTLKKLDALDKPIITVFNKQDKLQETVVIKDLKAVKTLNISAKKGNGLEQLLILIEEVLREQSKYIETIIPYQEGSIMQMIRKYGQIEEENYVNEGVSIKAYLPQEIYAKITKITSCN